MQTRRYKHKKGGPADLNDQVLGKYLDGNSRSIKTKAQLIYVIISLKLRLKTDPNDEKLTRKLKTAEKKLQNFK